MVLFKCPDCGKCSVCIQGVRFICTYCGKEFNTVPEFVIHGTVHINAFARHDNYQSHFINPFMSFIGVSLKAPSSVKLFLALCALVQVGFFNRFPPKFSKYKIPW